MEGQINIIGVATYMAGRGIQRVEETSFIGKEV
jgi:hypothetical protein